MHKELQTIETKTSKHICFKINSENFSIPIDNLQEVLLPQSITPVIHTPQIVRGITNLRGTIIAVLDLHEILGQSNTAENQENVRIVVASNGEKSAGLLVDYIEDVEEVAPHEIRPIEKKLASSKDFYDGVAVLETRTFTILSINKILNHPELREFYEY
ncbi:chemotaxis protein CheW [Candidatus Margulisiibacteriota bacterium]